MSTPAVDAVKPVSLARGQRLAQLALRYGALLLLLLLCAVVSLLSRSFIKVTNLTDVLVETADIGIIAVGETYVIIVRGIDVSVGAIVALASAVGVGAMMVRGQPWYVAVLIMLGVGLVVGFINGFSSSWLRMPAFLVTLATMTIAGGLVIAASGGHIWSGLPQFFNVVGQGHVGPIPNPVIIMLVVFVLGYLLLSRTTFGRQVYAVGTNPNAARVSGIKVERVILLAFVLCGFLSGLAGLVLTSRMDAFTASFGTNYNFSAITACVIGGTSLFGGVGGMGGTLIGVLIMGVINNSLNLLGVSAFYQGVLRGAIVFLAVLIDTIRRRYTQLGD